MDKVMKRAYAKINTVLDIKGRYPNGYHILDMIMLSINVYDTITLTKTKRRGIELFSQKSMLPLNSSNLVYKAIDVIRKRYGIETGVRAEIKKVIPMSAGLAGGSSDCAAALRGMKELFDIDISEEELYETGKTLGADVPFCLYGAPARAEGIGDILTPIADLPPCGIVLAKPRISMPTASAFREFDSLKEPQHPNAEKMIKFMEDGDIDGVCSQLGNVLESVTIKKHPIVGELKDEMQRLGALGSLMSGSGSAVFGIFRDDETAEKACLYIRDNYDVESVFSARALSRSDFV